MRLWLLLCLGLIAVPGLADAHPVDEVVLGAYLFLAPDEVRLELDLTPGIEVLDALVSQLDPNGDRVFEASETLAFGAMVLDQAPLLLDGVAAGWHLQSVQVPVYSSLQQGDVIKILATAARPESAGEHQLDYENNYAPARTQRAANVFLQPGKTWAYTVTGQSRSEDGTGLTVSYAVAPR